MCQFLQSHEQITFDHLILRVELVLLEFLQWSICGKLLLELLILLLSLRVSLL